MRSESEVVVGQQAQLGRRESQRVEKRLVSDRKKVATNADSMIGQEAIVKEKIDNREDTGRVLASGLLWTARTVDGSTMEPGETCTVDSIVGVKLIVRRKPEA